MTLTSFLDYLLSLIYSLTSNYGISIILLSLVVNIFLIPLFWISEKIQDKERSRQDTMQKDLAAINGVENKNEKYFYTLEIYKRHNYKTYYSLVGSLGFLVQVPFFLAAYWLLEDYSAITGESFSFIQDLSKPDNAFTIEWLSINVLPFVMTLINIVGILQIRKKIESKQGIQLFITALLFLVLLYNSPASLLLYWTTSNVFSIVKNSFTYNSKPNLSSHFSLQLYIERILIFLNSHSYELLFTIRAIATSFFVSHIISLILNENQSSRIFLAASISVLGFGTIIKQHRIFLLSFVTSVLYGLLILISNRFSSSLILAIFVFAYVLIVSQILFQLKKQKGITSVPSMLKDNFNLFLLPIVPALIFISSNPEYFSVPSGISFVLGFVILPMLLLSLTMLFGKHSQRIHSAIILANVIGLPTAFFLGPLVTDFFSSSTSTGGALYIVLFTLLFVSFLLWMISSNIRVLQILILSTIFSIPTIQYLFKSPTPQINVESIVEANLSLDFTSNQKLLLKPDIYLLIYDAYTDSEQLRRLYGIENKVHEDFLEESGFEIIDNIYSLDIHSIATMSSLLNMSGPITGEAEQRQLINGESKAHQVLHNSGYFTQNVLNPWMLRGIKISQVGFSYPDPSITDKSDGLKPIIKSILTGEFKFNMEYGDHVEWRRILKDQISQETIPPKFIYAHNAYPGHSQNSGTLLPNETELFEDRLRLANQDMMDDINQILSLEKESIIIIAGDHGPYLTGDGRYMNKYDEQAVTRDHLLDRFGCFLAVRYPDSLRSNSLPKIEVLQDVLASIFSTLSTDYNYKTLKKSSSAPLNTKITGPAIINGVINIGSDKEQPLYIRD